MNREFTKFAEYEILRYMGSGDGVSSLKHKLDCRIASSNAIVSHLNGINGLEKLIANNIANVLAVTYIPFGKRGKIYVENILKTENKTIEENAKEHLLYIARDENISEYDIEDINLGTKYLELDIQNIPIPTYDNLPHIMFFLHEMLDELNRSGLWPDDQKLSCRDYIINYACYNMEKTNRFVLPEKIVQVLISKQYIEFENSNLNEREENYLKEYLNKVNFFSKTE